MIKRRNKIFCFILLWWLYCFYVLSVENTRYHHSTLWSKPLTFNTGKRSRPSLIKIQGRTEEQAGRQQLLQLQLWPWVWVGAGVRVAAATFPPQPLSPCLPPSLFPIPPNSSPPPRCLLSNVTAQKLQETGRVSELYEINLHARHRSAMNWWISKGEISSVGKFLWTSRFL